MIFSETKLAGAFLIEPERHVDERGYFARTWCAREFEAHGLNAALVQCSVSFNRRAATLRGMHFQAGPRPETKLVRCTRGAVYDVLLDLRPHSATYLQWCGLDLTADNQRMLYVPGGIAHGFLTRADETELLYQISDYHAPELARGVRWNDPAFAIQWPAAPVVMAERDRCYPDFAAGRGEAEG